MLDAPQDAVITPGAVTRVAPETRSLDQLEDLTRSARRPLLLVEGVLDPTTAARLEDRNVGFVDRSARAWLPGHPKSTTARSEVPAGRRMRGPQIRMAQLVADHPYEDWTQRGLAERGRSTQQTAHRLLNHLEQLGHLHRTGVGRAGLRHVVNPKALRSWLASAAAPRRGGLLRCYVPDPDDLEELHVPLALTGAAAARAIGLPVLTGDRPPIYRARTTPAVLEDIPSALGGFRTDQGHNLALLADVDDLAHLDASRVEGRFVAPPSRIMLDLYLEPRGQAAVGVFLDLWGRGASE